MKKWLITGALLSVFLIAGCSTNTQNVENPKESPGIEARQKIDASAKTSNAVKSLDLTRFFPDETILKYAKEMIGKEAPDFSLTNLNGKEVSLSDFKGQDFILEIAKTTCQACMNFQPEMDKFKADNPNIPVVQVFPFEEETEVNAFLSKLNSPVNDNILTGTKRHTLVNDYKITRTPTMFFINKEGYIAFLFISDIEKELIEDMVEMAFE